MSAYGAASGEAAGIVGLDAERQIPRVRGEGLRKSLGRRLDGVEEREHQPLLRGSFTGHGGMGRAGRGWNLQGLAQALST